MAKPPINMSLSWPTTSVGVNSQLPHPQSLGKQVALFPETLLHPKKGIRRGKDVKVGTMVMTPIHLSQIQSWE